MKCSRCNREITESQAYVHQGKMYCEDCLMDIGLSTRECDPWSSYVDTRTKERDLKGKVQLTTAEQEIYDYIKDKGKATREEVMKKFGLSDLELSAQLIALMHSEMVKERSEAGKQYLVPIPVAK